MATPELPEPMNSETRTRTYIDPTQIQQWLPPMEPRPLLLQRYPHGYATSPGPQLLPPFQQFHPMQAPADGRTPPPLHSLFPEAVPGLPSVALPYLPPISHQTPIVDFVNLVPNPSSSAPTTVLYCPLPQLTPKHSFTRDPVLGSLTISKSERVEELKKMADVAKRSRDVSGDLPKAAGATLKGLDGEVNRDYLNNKTLPGLPVPSGKFGGRSRMSWDNDDDVISTDNRDQEGPQQGERRELMRRIRELAKGMENLARELSAEAEASTGAASTDDSGSSDPSAESARALKTANGKSPNAGGAAAPNAESLENILGDFSLGEGGMTRNWLDLV
ncbi:hypothetical protein BYT27DRAFT_7261239 [Phlegmacium glaucopus]|nr:hypothetical protein BYT27DRAFT_7261239 [Phlegmacium glaucopus]